MSFVGGWCGDRFPQRWVIAVAYVCLAVVGYCMYNVAVTIRRSASLPVRGLLRQRLRLHQPALDAATQRAAIHGGPSFGNLYASTFGAASIAGYSMGAFVGRFGWGTAAMIQLTLLPVIGIIAMALVDPSKLIVPKKVQLVSLASAARRGAESRAQAREQFDFDC